MSIERAVVGALAMGLLWMPLACSKEAPELKKEERQLAAFESIRARGSFAMDISSGPTQTVTISGAAEDINQVITKHERGNRLMIEAPDGLEGSPPLTVTIKLPKLKAFYAAGELNVSIRDLQQKATLLDVSGKSRVTASGTLEYAQIDGTGMSHIEAQHLATKRIEATASGNCSMDLRVEDVLMAEIVGKSTIGYYGAPAEVKKNVSRGGEVIHRGP